MAANTSPIFTVSAEVGWASTNPITAAVTGTTGAGVFDGTNANTLTVFTAGPNGSFVQKLVLEAGGSNAASVLRVHINNGGTNSTASNNTLYMQYSLPLTTTDNDAAISHLEIPLNIQIPTGYKILVTLGANSTPLTGGWYVTCIAGDY
jgi:protein involved in polysaccharide export with SLBB domain